MISASLSRLTSIHPAVTRPTSGQSTPRNKPAPSPRRVSKESRNAQRLTALKARNAPKLTRDVAVAIVRAKPAQPKMPQSRMLKAGVL